MALTMDWPSRIINSDASITDVVAFKDELRALEQSATGVLYPEILTYKRVSTGTGFQHFVDIINSYKIRFPVPGEYEIIGNINSDVAPVPNVSITREKAVSFIRGEGSGLTDDQSAMLDALWRMRGLDPVNPVTITPTLEQSGDIDIAVTGDGVNTSTLTRQ